MFAFRALTPHCHDMPMYRHPLISQCWYAMIIIIIITYVSITFILIHRYIRMNMCRESTITQHYIAACSNFLNTCGINQMNKISLHSVILDVLGCGVLARFVCPWLSGNPTVDASCHQWR